MLAERLQLESEEECPHERPGHFIAVVKPRRARRAQSVNAALSRRRSRVRVPSLPCFASRSSRALPLGVSNCCIPFELPALQWGPKTRVATRACVSCRPSSTASRRARGPRPSGGSGRTSSAGPTGTRASSESSFAVRAHVNGGARDPAHLRARHPAGLRTVQRSGARSHVSTVVRLRKGERTPLPLPSPECPLSKSERPPCRCQRGPDWARSLGSSGR
jgi:hypothetical protein